MERRNSQGKSTYDLLSWSNQPDASQSRGPVRHSATNNSQGFTMANDEHPTEAAPQVRSGIRILQPSGASQIQFGDDFGAPVPARRGNYMTEAAKQRQLSGSHDSYEQQPRRPMSNAKAKEMSGSNIFGVASYEEDGSRRSHDQKAAELSGNGIFRPSDDGTHTEKFMSDAKRKEMSGNNIFSGDVYEQPAPQQSSSNRVRKPPDVAAKIQQFTGSNPVQPEASAECMAHPPRMSDKHISETKMKEMNGTCDLFRGDQLGQVETMNNRPTAPSRFSVHDHRSEKLHTDAKRQEISGNYDLLSYDPDRHDNADYIKCTREKPASKSKLRELSGSYVFGDCFSVPPQGAAQQS